MNSLVFYNIILFALLCIFIPSVYNYMYSSATGRVIIILLIAYFSKVNFYLGLIFVTLIIIKSSSLYEGFDIGQSGIITTNYQVEEGEKKNPKEVFSYFTDFYCSNSNKQTPDQTKMNTWNNLANNSKNTNILTVAKYNIDKANTICSADTRPSPQQNLEWNISNSKIGNKCMGGWSYIDGLCYGPPGAKCSPYSWDGMKNYDKPSLDAWTSGCGINNTNVAIENAEKIKNSENSCSGGGGNITLYSINNPSIPTLSLSNFPALASMKNWELDVDFMCNGGSSSWRALIGDMYNSTSWRGWGLWVSASNGIHWSWKSTTWDAPGFFVKIGVKYNVNVKRSDGILTVTLSSPSLSEKKVASVSYKDKMTYGPVTIGGWISYNGERFPGDIYSINVKNTENDQNNGTISSRIFNTPLCLSNNLKDICSSIKDIDSQITKVLNPNVSDRSDPAFQQDAQWLKNTYQNLCVTSIPKF